MNQESTHRIKNQESRIRNVNNSRKRVGFLHDSLFMIHNSRGGFSTMELLIAVSIIIVISSVMFADMRSLSKNLPRSAQKLVLDIRRTQNFSLAPSEESNCIYGIKNHDSDNTKYIIYKDADCGDGTAKKHGAGSVDIETISIEKGVSISGVGCPLACSNVWDFAFEAPEPITYFTDAGSNDGAKDFSEQTITLTLSNDTKKVKVNRFGRVEIAN